MRRRYVLPIADRWCQRDLRAISFGLVSLGLLLIVLLPWSAGHIKPSASTTDNLNGLVILDVNNGWAVGNAGTISHFDGSSWSLIPSGTSANLFGVSFGQPSAPNANSGFAVGGDGVTAVALFWSGVSWFPVSAGLSSPDAKELVSVFSLNPSDAWAVDSVSGAFWHWSGTAGLGGGWNEASRASGGLNSIFMTSGSDGWAVGVGGIIYHYTGGGWTLFSAVGITLNSLFMVNQNEGWAVGDGGAIFHFASGTWSGPFSPSTTSQNLKAVSMVSQTEGWAVGASGTILHYSSGAWTSISSPSGTTQNLNAVSLFGENGWAAGDLGTIIPLGPQGAQGVPAATFQSVYLSSSSDGWIVGGTGGGEAVALHWNGNTFTRGTVLSSTSDLYSVFMVNPSEGWAVGGSGNTPAILHYTGGSWVQVATPTVNAILRSVFMLDGNNGWAVGDNGVILRYSASFWGIISAPTSNSLRSVFMVGSSDGWAVGDGGTILRYQPLSGQWITYPSPTSARLNAVFLTDSSHGWAVGDSGTILHFDGSLWLNVPDTSSANLNSVVQVDAQEAWAVGDSATILHWTGISWDQFSPPLSGNPNLNSIFTLSDRFGLIVGAPAGAGSQGTILRAPTMNPVPELPKPQILLIAIFITTLGMLSIRHRKPGSNRRYRIG